MKLYDTTKPRFTVHTNTYPSTDFETLSVVEVTFWRSIGYLVSEHRWNGQMLSLIHI